MPDIFSDQLMQVVRDLALAGIVYLAYKFARDASKKSGRIPALARGAAWVIGISIFAVVMMGRPSCEDGDQLFGTCSEYADNDFTPTNSQRGARFLYFAVLLGAPTIMGVMSVKGHPLNPWAKPDSSRL